MNKDQGVYVSQNVGNRRDFTHADMCPFISEKYTLMYKVVYGKFRIFVIRKLEKEKIYILLTST